MLALLAFGTIWFYLLLGIISILIMICVAGEKISGGWASVWVITTFVGLYFLGSKEGLMDVLTHIIHHPFETIVLFLVYVAIGTFWSFVEWYWYVNKKLADALEDRPYSTPSKPMIDHHKSRIFTWIFYWPWTMLWKLIHKPIEKLFEQIMRWTKTTYDNITNRAFDKAAKSAAENVNNK